MYNHVRQVRDHDTQKCQWGVVGRSLVARGDVLHGTKGSWGVKGKMKHNTSIVVAT